MRTMTTASLKSLSVMDPSVMHGQAMNGQAMDEQAMDDGVWESSQSGQCAYGATGYCAMSAVTVT